MKVSVQSYPAPIPSVEWEITTRCNYDCSYCTQRTYAGLNWGDCTDQTVDAMLAMLRARPAPLHVKLSGGEPFVHPRFLEIVGEVAKMSHSVSTTTNFSVPQRILSRFLEETGPQLDFLTASLHLTQVRNIDEFIDKARWFQSSKPDGAHFVVTTVGVESDAFMLRTLADRFAEEEIAFEIAPLKDGAHYVQYSDPAFETFVQHHALSRVQEIRGSNMMGTMCHTGHQFIRVTVDGDALRCYNVQPRFALGNIARGNFTWLEGPKPCLARQCTCTVPANRHMIEYGNRADARVMIRELASAAVEHGPSAVRLGWKWAWRSLKGIDQRR